MSKSDLADTQPLRSRSLADTQPRKVVKIDPTQVTVSKPKFSWPAFFTMAVVIGIVLSLGMFVPGIIDEYAALLIVTAVYGFMAANGFKIKNIFKK